MDMKKDYEIKAQLQLDKWRMEINTLKTKSGYSQAGCTSAPHAQTIATSKDHNLAELQPDRKDYSSAPQTIATAEGHKPEELHMSDDHEAAPQTIATSKLHKQIEVLQSKHDSATRKLENLKDADDDSWKDLKPGVEAEMNSLGNELKSISSR
tara:strand:- start:532 stop:990 length:459 start_codon:yes stop_codon:yes gene_type:complete